MSNVTITIKSNLRAQIEGDYDSQALDDLLSFRKSQFWWKCRAAQMGLWDGKTRLFDAVGGTFPLGLLRKVRDWLTEQGVNVNVVDPRPPLPAPPKDLPALEGATLRPYQERAVRRALRHGRGIVHAATGSGKTEVAIALVKALGQPVTLFLTGRIKLVRQTRERFATRLGCDLNDIGIIQGGKWIESPLGIYVATVSSLMSRKFEEKRKALFRTCELLILDEAHHAASTSWYRVALSCKARRRIGLTGTPKGRSDGADLMLEAATGPVIARVRAQELIDKGVLARPRIFLTRVTTPQVITTEWKTARDRGIVENAYRNQLIANYAAQGQSMGLKGLILVHHIKQGWILHRMLPNSRFVYGHTLDCQVDRAVEALQEGSIKTLIASSIFQEGVDIPCVNLLIMASGGKSPIEILQKIGRGMRRKEDDNTLLVLDFWDDTHHYLRRHSSERKKIYEAENFEVKVLEGPQQLIHLKSTPQKV